MRLAQSIAPAMIGALTGAGAMLLLPSRTAPPAPRANEPRPIVVAGADRRVDALGGQVRALEAQVQALALAHETASATPAAAPPRAQPDPTESRQAGAERFAREFESRLSARSGEPRNAAWAGTKEASLTQGLPRIAAATHQSFSLVGVDCLSTTCVARLEWPSEQAARTELPKLLRGTGELGCANQIAFPPGGEPYRASLLFDCAEEVAGLVH
jgi:hypothetical protein